jgi:DNA-binding NarL/FixJ family response regulator
VSAIFRKLGAHDRTQAVVYALRRGIIPLGYVDGGAGI